jgi:hypothetical protein
MKLSHLDSHELPRMRWSLLGTCTDYQVGIKEDVIGLNGLRGCDRPLTVEEQGRVLELQERIEARAIRTIGAGLVDLEVHEDEPFS